jgi:hypothetical protein
MKTPNDGRRASKHAKWTALFLLIINLGAVRVCDAETLINFTASPSVFTDQSFNYGYQFTVGSQPITITKLGVYDLGGGDGLANAHQVGLWDASQNLLRSTTVPSGTDTDLNGYTHTANNAFRYVAITPITLSANTPYVIAANYPSGNADGIADLGNNGTLAAGAGITLNMMRYQAGGALSFPTTEYVWASAIGGPNADFTVVPEPGSLSTVTAAVFLVWQSANRIRRRR